MIRAALALCLLAGASPALAQAAPPTPAPSTAPAEPAPTRPRRATLEERFREANTTGDGRLTFAQAQARMPSVGHEFDAIDKDHKGWVTLDDIRAHQAEKRRLRRVKPAQPPG